MTQVLRALVWVAFAWASSAQSAVLINDDFTSNSAGIPSAWSQFLDDGSAMTVESGSVITMSDNSGSGPNLLTAGTYDPQNEQTSMSIGLTSLTTSTSALFGLADSTVTNFMVLRIDQDGDIVLITSNTGPGPAANTTLGTLAGYDGSGFLDVSFIFDETSFSVTADSGSFTSSGTYASVVAGGFDFTGIGSTANLLMGVDGGTGVFDSALFEVTETGGGTASSTEVPLPAPFLMMLLGLAYLRRNRG